MSRTIYSFPVPPSLQSISAKIEVPITTMEFVELTVDEEQQASRRARNDIARLSAELSFASFQGINGTPASLGDGDRDTLWKNLHPKLRSLSSTAYNKLHSPTNEEAEGFLEGMSAAAGSV